MMEIGVPIGSSKRFEPKVPVRATSRIIIRVSIIFINRITDTSGRIESVIDSKVGIGAASSIEELIFSSMEFKRSRTALNMINSTTSSRKYRISIKIEEISHVIHHNVDDDLDTSSMRGIDHLSKVFQSSKSVILQNGNEFHENEPIE
jgi:hypothetical protein